MKNSIQTEFLGLMAFSSPEEEIEFKASLLAMQFLGLADQKMKELNLSKKELAAMIGTSASFITQMFRGDRNPNWNILAKMSKALELEFKVMTEDLINERIQEGLTDYHKKWVKTRQYEQLKGFQFNPELVMAVESSDEDYAMAG